MIYLVFGDTLIYQGATDSHKRATEWAKAIDGVAVECPIWHDFRQPPGKRIPFASAIDDGPVPDC